MKFPSQWFQRFENSTSRVLSLQDKLRIMEAETSWGGCISWIPITVHLLKCFRFYYVLLCCTVFVSNYSKTHSTCVDVCCFKVLLLCFDGAKDKFSSNGIYNYWSIVSTVQFQSWHKLAVILSLIWQVLPGCVQYVLLISDHVFSVAWRVQTACLAVRKLLCSRGANCRITVCLTTEEML